VLTYHPEKTEEITMSLIQHVRTPDRQCRWHQHVPPTHGEVTNLSGSVGERGANHPADVSAVQSRLNRVSAADGGPTVPLGVDGKCGPLTRAAVLRFQRRYPGELIGDGRIDVGKSTWKKLVALSDGVATAGLPRTLNAPATGTPTSANAVMLLNTCLWLSRHRIYQAIRALDVAAQEVMVCEAKNWVRSGTEPLILFQVYQEIQDDLKELPTVDRCFHIAGPQMTTAGVREILRRVRKVYTDMLDVIVRNNFTTPAAERSGTRRFIRLVSDQQLRRTHRRVVIADAPEGGWWVKNANIYHIRFNATMVEQGDVITTLIHELAHFVSHHSSYMIGHHRPNGEHNNAFNDTHAQAVRNSYCYEWYAFLASFKDLRNLPNADLVLT
jgi:hypothetical protein